MATKAEKLKRELDLGVLREDGNIPCRNYPDAYFPEAGVTNNAPITRQAIEGCRQCPLMNLCAEYAIEADEEYGIWGGLTRQKRLQLVKLKRRKERYATALKLS